MLVMVGPDRCGKTTLGYEALKKYFGSYYYHHTKPPMDTFLYFARFFMTASPRAVVDRCHWCEYAYGNTYRGKSNLTRTQFNLLEMALASREATVVYMNDKTESIRERWSDEEMFSDGPLDTLMDYYCEIYEKSSLNKYSFDLKTLQNMEGYEHGVEKIIEESSPKWSNSPVSLGVVPSNGIGFARKGSILFVGEDERMIDSGGVQIPHMYDSSPVWDIIHTTDIWNRSYVLNTRSLSLPTIETIIESYDFAGVIYLERGDVLTWGKNEICIAGKNQVERGIEFVKSTLQ